MYCLATFATVLHFEHTCSQVYGSGTLELCEALGYDSAWV